MASTTTSTTTTTTSITVTTHNLVPQVVASHPAPQELVTMAHIAAPRILRVEDRKKPLKLCAVLDVSGSMSGEKLRLAVRSLQFIVDELSTIDEFSVVTFSDNVSTIVPPTRMDVAGKRRVKNIIETQCKARGNTNLSGGLFQALTIVAPTLHINPYMYPLVNPPYVTSVNYNSAPLPPWVATARPLPVPAPLAPPAPPAAAPAPSPKPPAVFFVTVKGQHALVPRDGKRLHGYWFQLATTPANVLAEATFHANGSAPKSGLDVALDPQEAPVAALAVDVAVKHQPATAGLKLLHILADPTADETCAVYKVEGGVFTPHAGEIPELPAWPETTVAPPAAPPVAPPTTTTTTTTTVTFAPPPRPTDAYCRSILLFTDGQANRGLTDVATIKHGIARHLVQSSVDATISTFGYGSDPNTDLLRGIAESTQGSYYFVADVASMAKTFADCVGGLVSTVAQAVRVTITPAPGVSIAKVLTYYPVTINPDGSVTVVMKDLFSEEFRDLPVRLNVCPGFVPSPAVPVVEWSVQYDSCITSATEVVKARSVVACTAEPYTGAPDVAVDEQLNRFVVTEAMEEAKRAAEARDFETARVRLASAKAKVCSSASAANAYCCELANEMDDLDDCLNAPAWSSHGQQTFANGYMQHAQQRCAKPSSGGAYANAFKDSMKARASFH